MTTCTCGKPTRDDAYLCDDCLTNLARALGDVPWIVEELETTLTGERSPLTQDGGRTATCTCADDDDKCAHVLVPFHIAASEALANLRHQLVLLARFCVEEGVRSRGGDELPGDADNPATEIQLSRWLMWRVDGLAFVDMAPEFADAVIKAVGRAQRVIDNPPERAYAGVCPECEADLYHAPTAVTVSCRACGTKWPTAEVRAWMNGRIDEHMNGLLVTSKEAATLLGRLGFEVSQDAISKWGTRGRVAIAGTRVERGVPSNLYRWTEVLELASKRTAKTEAS